MKEFFKMFFASCLGIMVGMVLLFFLLTAIGTSAALSGKKEVKTDKVLDLDFNWITTEKTGNIEQDFTNFDSPEAIGVHDLARAIKQATTDDNIEGIILRPFGAMVGQSSMLEIIDALEEFRESDKFVYAYADFYTQRDYFLSMAADSIFLNPNGQVDVKGFGVMNPYFKKGLDDLGVKFDIFYAGDFKSATEPFRLTQMSDENRLQTKEFLSEMEEIMSSKLSAYRNIDAAKLNSIYNEGLGRNADMALSNKLVDDLKYWSEVEAIIKEKLGKKASSTLKPTPLVDYVKNVKLNDSEGDRNQKIAIVYAEGNVGYGKPTKGTITDQEYVKILQKIYHDDKYKAVVLRVNSPGGSALTSDIIWHEIEQIKSKGIPVVASFGDYAASGGYYIAAGADKIVSEPNTLTGSIGVFAMLPNIKGLMTDKLGVNFDTVKTHDLAIGYNGIMDLSDKEKTIFQESTIETYEKFLSRVAAGRKMTRDQVHEVAQGRVWTGQKAKELNLVDEIGSLDDAITMAAELAKLEGYTLREFPYIKKDVFQELMKELSKSMNEEDAQLLPLTQTNKRLLKLYQDNKYLLQSEGMQYRSVVQLDF